MKPDDKSTFHLDSKLIALLRSFWNLDARLVLGALLWTQSLFLAATFRTWYAVTLCMGLATLLVVVRNRLHSEESKSSRFVPRWIGWLSLFVLFLTSTLLVAVWRLGNQVGDEINLVFVVVDTIAHAAMVAGLIIWVMRPRRGHVAMLTLGLIVVLLSVAAGGASVSLAAQTTVALATCLGFTLGSQIILGAGNQPAKPVAGPKVESERAAWLAPTFSLLTLSVLMMATSAIANATNFVLPAIQAQLQEQLKASLDAVGEQNVIGGTRYVRGGRIGSIRRHMLGNPREVALQAYCQVPPGYLRGSVFDVYRDGRWIDSGSVEFLRYGQRSGVRDESVMPTSAGTTVLQRQVKPVLQRFSLVDSASDQVLSVEIHNDPMKGPMVFLPLTTHWLEARSREIFLTQHGIVRVGVDVTRPYVAGVGPMLPREELREPVRTATLEIAPSLLPLLRPIAQRLCRATDSPAIKAAAISNYFQREFDYSLAGVSVPEEVDPLVHFLRSQHDAHCEYFASATVLLLRSVGVPARYVTGYVADELSENEAGLWLARNQDAHAWAEAFDDASGRWFPVESTPGRRYQTIEFEGESSVSDGMLAGLLDRGDDEDDSWLSRTLGWLASVRATEPLLIIFRLTQLPLFLVLLFVLWRRYLQPTRAQGNQVEMLSRKMLRQTDRGLRKYDLVRRPSETLYQFADRIEQLASDGSRSRRSDFGPRLLRTAHWYRDFADARYQGRMPPQPEF